MLQEKVVLSENLNNVFPKCEDVFEGKQLIKSLMRLLCRIRKELQKHRNKKYLNFGVRPPVLEFFTVGENFKFEKNNSFFGYWWKMTTISWISTV